MTEPDSDANAAHRWFAVELNNLAWDLVEAAHRSDEDTERMIHAAHASTWHWMQIGQAVHVQRAMCLLANVYVTCGCGERAVHYAEHALRLSNTNDDDEQSAFDRATALACAAAAYRCDGQDERAGQYSEQAQQALQDLRDHDERRIADEMLQRCCVADKE